MLEPSDDWSVYKSLMANCTKLEQGRSVKDCLVQIPDYFALSITV